MEKVEHQRNIINQIGYDMLILCKSQLQKANEALINNDNDLAEEVMHTESRVNSLDLRIERDCEKFIALYNPVAIDLRFVMVIRKINSDLERIADHAYNISKYVVEKENKIAPQLLKALNVEDMFKVMDSMLEHITIAYKDKNVKEARKVFKKDKKLDKIKLESFKIIEEQIIKDTKIIGDALLLFSVLNKWERVGDLLKNIAEEIIFYIDAEVLKHRRKK
jgi:phosphate transport system protein